LAVNLSESHTFHKKEDAPESFVDAMQCNDEMSAKQEVLAAVDASGKPNEATEQTSRLDRVSPSFDAASEKPPAVVATTSKAESSRRGFLAQLSNALQRTMGDESNGR
jgi:hypothetical protein